MSIEEKHKVHEEMLVAEEILVDEEATKKDIKWVKEYLKVMDVNDFFKNFNLKNINALNSCLQKMKK